MLSWKSLRAFALAAGCAATGMAAVAEWAMRRRGDADIYLDTAHVHGIQVESVDSHRAVVYATVPFANRGRQQGCILDAGARVLPHGDRYRGLEFEVSVHNTALPREDGYFEAIMFKEKDRVELGVELTVRQTVALEPETSGQEVMSRLDQIGHVRLELRYSFYMRSPLQYRRVEYDLPVGRLKASTRLPNGRSGRHHASSPAASGGEEGAHAAACNSAAACNDVPSVAAASKVAQAAGPEAVAGDGALSRPPSAAVESVVQARRQVGVAIPIHTHLLTPRDRFLDVVERYAVPLARRGDVVAVAESALAIIQGRLYHVEEIHPRWLARKACRMLDADSSLSTPYGLEMALRVCGTPRILLAFVAGVLGKLGGRQGDFYRVAGPAVATIDDASGTLAPFDKHVVLGPVDAQKTVDEVRTRFGLEAAVVDANDLKRVMVLSITDETLRPFVEHALVDNPQGNAAEQTPLILIPRS